MQDDDFLAWTSGSKTKQLGNIVLDLGILRLAITIDGDASEIVDDMEGCGDGNGSKVCTPADGRDPVILSRLDSPENKLVC